MIITSTEIKAYLNISSTEYDVLIAAYIDPVLNDFFDYTGNTFKNDVARLSGDIFTFSTTGTIVVDGTNFSTYSFASGDEIMVEGSARNDGYYTASSVSSATITVSTTQTLKAEGEESDVLIYKVDFPASAKPLLAQMVKFKIDNPTGLPMSESLGDYSVTYGSNKSGYPAGIENAMRKYYCLRYT